MSKKIDLTGQKFGKLVVLCEAGKKKNRARWLCRCDCGRTSTPMVCNLRGGNSKSCGLCVRKEDLAGEKFGRLIVVCFKGTDKHRTALWLCECECGGEKIASANLLKRGRLSSCGCLYKETRTEVGRKHGVKNLLRHSPRKLPDECYQKEPDKLKRARVYLLDCYVKSLIRNHSGLRSSEISQELVETKRADIKLYRTIKKLEEKHGLS